MARGKPAAAKSPPPRRFRVAFSFPGERRRYVKKVDAFLTAALKPEAVFYDKRYQAELAQVDLDTHLQQIYGEDADLVVVFLCREYAQKEWCGVEWRVIRDMIKQRRTLEVMPFRFDGARVPGLFSTDGYIDASKITAQEAANLILERLGLMCHNRPAAAKPAEPTPPPASRRSAKPAGPKVRASGRRSIAIGGKARGPVIAGDGNVVHIHPPEPNAVARPRKVKAGPGRLFLVPNPPMHFTERPELFEKLKATLLGATAPVGLVGAGATVDGNADGRRNGKVGVHGMGGVGKSVLAAALARDPDVRAAFLDGIIWLTLGQTPNLPGCQSQLGQALGDNLVVSNDAEINRGRLQPLLREKKCLVILDDVWKLEHVHAFTVSEPKAGLLITTRDAGLLRSLDAQVEEIDRLEPEQALDLLASWAGTTRQDLPPVAKEVAAECGHLALALAMIGAMVREHGECWADALELLRRGDLEAIQQEFPDYSCPNLFLAIKISVDALDEATRRRYFDFAVFPEDVAVPESVLVTLWAAEGLNRLTSLHLVKRLVDLSLLWRDGEGRLSLHDLQRDYIGKQIGDEAALHGRLLDAYRKTCPAGWHAGPRDAYLFERLAHHLLRAGRKAELAGLLMDYRWIAAKLDAAGVVALQADYEPWADEKGDIKTVADALRLSAHVLVNEPGQLAPQLHGRLGAEPGQPIQSLLCNVAASQLRPWLRPRFATLERPGSPLVRVLSGHEGIVYAVSFMSDGRRAISASEDGTLMVWDLVRGTCECTLSDHGDQVLAVAVTPDDRRALSGASDGTLKVWDLVTNSCERTLIGHKGMVDAVALSRDGGWAVSGSSDLTLKVWDLGTGELVRTLSGRMSHVAAVALTSDEKFVVSGSWDRTLRVWNLATGRCVRTLRGHKGTINAVSLVSNGHRVISASEDRTLKVWDLTSGSCERTLIGHEQEITGVAVTRDGRRAVSVSDDGVLKVWDLDSSSCLHTLGGHAYLTCGVAVTPDGGCALSALSNGDLRVWDLTTVPNERLPRIHKDRIEKVAITPDARRVVSASWDATLKVWDMATGECECVLAEQDDAFYSVVVTADGRWAVSGSQDGTVRVWNLATGRCLRILRGHRAAVRSIAVAATGQWAISGSEDGFLKVWDLQSGRCKRTVRSHKTRVCCLAITPDGGRAVSASWDGNLKVWSLASGKCVRTLRGHEGQVWAVTLTMDHEHAVSASADGTIRIWNLMTGVCERVLTGHNDGVYDVAIVPDKQLVVSVSWDRTLRVWKQATGELLTGFTGEGHMACCAVAPDGRMIVCGEAGGHIHFLRLEVPEAE